MIGDDLWVFIAHAHPVVDTGVGLLLIGFGDLERLALKIVKGDAGAQQRHIVLHLVIGEAIEVLLLLGWFCGTTVECARDVAEIAHRTHHIRVKTHQIAGFDHTLCGFLQPRVRAGPTGEHAAIMPAALIGKVRVIQNPPELGFRDTGAQSLFHFGHAKLCYRDRPFDTFDFVGGFDQTRGFGQRHAIHNFKAALQAGLRHRGIHIFNRNPPIVGANLFEIARQAVSQVARIVHEVGSGIKKGDEIGRFFAVNQRAVSIAAKHNGRPVLRHQ